MEGTLHCISLWSEPFSLQGFSGPWRECCTLVIPPLSLHWGEKPLDKEGALGQEGELSSHPGEGGPLAMEEIPPNRGQGLRERVLFLSLLLPHVVLGRKPPRLLWESYAIQIKHHSPHLH